MPGSQLNIGQRVRLGEGAAKYQGLSGVVIHSEWVTEQPAFRRENPHGEPGVGRRSVIVQLDDPPEGFEPVLFCFLDQVSLEPLD